MLYIIMMMMVIMMIMMIMMMINDDDVPEATVTFLLFGNISSTSAILSENLELILLLLD